MKQTCTRMWFKFFFLYHICMKSQPGKSNSIIRNVIKKKVRSNGADVRDISFVNYTASFSCKLDNGRPSWSVSRFRPGDISLGMNSESAATSSISSVAYLSDHRCAGRKKKNVVSVRGNKTLCEFSQTTFVLIIISRSTELIHGGAIHDSQNPGSIAQQERETQSVTDNSWIPLSPRNYNARQEKTVWGVTIRTIYSIQIQSDS